MNSKKNTLTGVDKSFFHVESDDHLMTVASCSIFHEHLDFTDLKNTLQLLVNQYDRFSQRVTKPSLLTKERSWENYNFSLLDHVTEIKLSSFSDSNSSDDYRFNKELQFKLSELFASPFDNDKALWKCELIHFHPNRSALFFRVHHCVTDGQGAIRCLLSLTNNSKNNELQYGKQQKTETKNKLSSHPPFYSIASLKLLFINIIRLLIFIVDLSWGFILSTWHFISILLFFKRNHFNGKLTQDKIVSFSGDVKLDKVKEIKNHFNVSVNDVLISSLAGSFREFILNSEGSVKDNNLLTYIPVSMRKQDDWELGNKVSIVFAHLPLNIEDPVERLNLVHNRMDKIKHSKEPLATYIYTETLGNSPLSDTSISKKIMRKLLQKPHAIFTNVPGPRSHLEFAGKRIEIMFPFIPQPGDGGFGVALLSYVNTVSCTLVADKNILPDGGIDITSGLSKHVEALYSLLPISN